MNIKREKKKTTLRKKKHYKNNVQGYDEYLIIIPLYRKTVQRIIKIIEGLKFFCKFIKFYRKINI